jgi:signal transduction histidine kinase
MSRKLVQTQERERRRIARELHDDINQRLAIMSIDLEAILKKHGPLPSEVRDMLVSVRERTMELSSDIETLSHELHSSKLEYLGLVNAMESFCREFGTKHSMEINFRTENMPVPPSQEVSMCLFRILQESLKNAAKHSGAKNLHVILASRSGQVHLRISDSGRGFDLERVLKGVGLGITSMQERIRLVNGSINIQSKPSSGTTIDILVPLGGKPRRLAG